MPEKMIDPPDIIYLQWHGEPYYNGTIDPNTDVSEVTWCMDEIWDVDIKYLLATPEREAATELLEALKGLRDYEDASWEADGFGNRPKVVEIAVAAIELATVK